MFSGIEKKLRVLYLLFFILFVIATVTASVILFIEGHLAIALVILFSGALLTWLSSFILYCFGELLLRVRSIDSKLDDMGTEESVSE